MSPLDLTIAIPVRNEQLNLPGCIERIGADFAARIVVIDSGSTDDTPAICERHGIERINFEWDGHFPKKRNWYLRNHPPATRWILFLDADEYLTEAFKRELRAKLPSSTKTGYWLNYTIHFLGKELRGGYPLKKLALFRVGAGEYEKIHEERWSNLDMEIHEHPILTGEIGTITSRIDHRDFRGVEHYVTKHNDYSSWEAGRFLKSMSVPEFFRNLTWKQKLKYRLMRSPLIGPIYFIGSYILMGGFRDGSRGLAFSLLKLGYFSQVYCKIQELQVSAEPIPPDQ